MHQETLNLIIHTEQADHNVTNGFSSQVNPCLAKPWNSVAVKLNFGQLSR